MWLIHRHFQSRLAGSSFKPFLAAASDNLERSVSWVEPIKHMPIKRANHQTAASFFANSKWVRQADIGCSTLRNQLIGLAISGDCLDALIRLSAIRTGGKQHCKTESAQSYTTKLHANHLANY
jgi:hypothetical protein